MTKRIRAQHPIPGGRLKMSLTAMSKISDHVAREARRFGVSKSFVIAVALADYFQITEQERYGA